MSDRTHDTELYDARSRILEAAARLIVEGGVAALTTRAVAAAASVQAPALYRLFGDKRGLLDALAERELAAFVARKAAADPHPDPVRNLRDAWQDYVAFGVENPAVFAITTNLGRTGPPSAATLAGMGVLRERVARVARAGRLRVPQERAVALIHAAGTGTVATLLAMPERERDPELSGLALDGVMSVLVGEAAIGAADNCMTLAIGLRAHLEGTNALSPGEGLLMGELLDRLIQRQDSALERPVIEAPSCSD